MREILFRGKRYMDGEWVDGSLFIDEKKERHEILVGYVNYRVGWDVDPATVGQFTGLTDKNGRKIFEGDIVKVPYFKISFEVKFVNEKARFLGEAHNGELISLLHSHKDIEVIGNIHDNPELLKGEER